MNERTVKGVLSTLLESVQDVAICLLREDGDTAEACQLKGLLVALNKAEACVNGITNADLRLVSEASLTDKDRASGYPLEKLLLDRSAINHSIESMVSNTLNARTDVSNMVYLATAHLPAQTSKDLDAG
ncbi:MAG: hypothetical protein C9356_11985 [Oleiphilus sp.]|nr:MAG: hypothetical protein C9356_11985 [Oleiphilus sp.]